MEEEAPLLKASSGIVELIGDDGDYLPARGVISCWRVFCIESSKVWAMGGPIAFQILCEFGTNFVCTIFVGHLGDVELSAFSIAITVIGNFGFGFLLGMGSALETLCGQAFGSGQVHMLGVYMQRSTIILFAACILLLPVFIFATPILKLIGQPDEIANLAGYYTMLTIPQLISLCITFPTQKFLQAQSKVSVLAWIAAVSLLAHVLWCWLFVIVFGWGAAGAAVAFDVTSWTTAISQSVYVVGWCKEGWKGFSWAAFTEMWAFVRLSLASAVMLCLEVWYMSSIVTLTGNLDNAVTSVGALSICMNINAVEGMFFIGMNVAISVRVSNELGLGRPRAAKYSVMATLFQSLLIGITCMIIILCSKNYIFTDSSGSPFWAPGNYNASQQHPASDIRCSNRWWVASSGSVHQFGFCL